MQDTKRLYILEVAANGVQIRVNCLFSVVVLIKTGRERREKLRWKEVLEDNESYAMGLPNKINEPEQHCSLFLGDGSSGEGVIGKLHLTETVMRYFIYANCCVMQISHADED